MATTKFDERSLEWWKEEVKIGLEFRNRCTNSNREWRKFRAMYRHQHFGMKSGMKVLPVNFIFAFGRAIIPQIAFRTPHVTVQNNRPGFEIHAKILEKLDNLILQQLNVVEEFRSITLDNFLCGIGIGFDGYDSEYGFAPELLSKDTNYSGTLSQFDKKGNRIEYNKDILPATPWFLRADPEDVVFPWGTSRARDIEWVATRNFRKVDDVKKDKKYKNTSTLKGNVTRYKTQGIETVPAPTNPPQQPVEEQKEVVELWQVRDFKTGSIVVFTMDHDNFLRNEDDELQQDSTIVHPVIFNEDPEYIYGVPDARIILPHQLEATEARTQAMYHRRVAVLKMLIAKNAMNKPDVDKLLDEDVKAAVFLNEGINPNEAVKFLSPDAGILQEMQMVINNARDDIRNMIGMGNNQVGQIQGKTHITKFETQQAQSVSNIRFDERREMLTACLNRVIRNFNRMIFRRWTSKRVEQIVGPDGVKYWVDFTGTQLESDYSYDINSDDSRPVNQDTLRSDAVELMKEWSTFRPGEPVPKELIRYSLQNYPGINIDAILAHIPDAPQQMPGMNQGQPVNVNHLGPMIQRNRAAQPKPGGMR